MKGQIKYRLYPTLLDSYQNYLSSRGFAKNPEMTELEFERKQFDDLIKRINREPQEPNRAADRGTAFNEVIDSMISGEVSDKIEVEKVYCTTQDGENQSVTGLNVKYNDDAFYFPISLCREFADYFKGAISQHYTEAILPTKYGKVLLYGYIDEVMPTRLHDIKTTKSYSVGNYKKNWQHVVYPYCMNENGAKVSDFEYNVAVINELKSGVTFETFVEYYNYNPFIDEPRLIAHVERFIGFLECNKELITDQKVFNFSK